MKLADFILSRKQQIMQEWEDFAGTILPNAGMDSQALRDHVGYLLDFIAKDMNSYQSSLEQSDKAQGLGEKEGGKRDSAAEIHAAVRFEEGFDLVQIASEFRALRASVIKLWSKQRNKAEDDYDEVSRFNESIDQILQEGLKRYNEVEQRARTLFLGMLVHDMRNPLGAISNAVELFKVIDNLDPTQTKIIEQIGRSNKTVIKLVSDLIDITRVRLGEGMPVSPVRMNMGTAVRHTAQEAELAAQRGRVSVETQGNLDGEWDVVRINQMLSNLIGNALQHGENNGGVKVTAREETEGVVLSVQNRGKPISAMDLPVIFNPLKRGSGEEQKKNEASSLGLGLFITKEIVEAHGGKIEVTSTVEGGTTFSAWLPRKALLQPQSIQ
ncbi:MAG: ATP-binding protein [Alphaproteobacteria bacterium]